METSIKGRIMHSLTQRVKKLFLMRRIHHRTYHDKDGVSTFRYDSRSNIPLMYVFFSFDDGPDILTYPNSTFSLGYNVENDTLQPII